MTLLLTTDAAVILTTISLLLFTSHHPGLVGFGAPIISFLNKHRERLEHRAEQDFLPLLRMDGLIF